MGRTALSDLPMSQGRRCLTTRNSISSRNTLQLLLSTRSQRSKDGPSTKREWKQLLRRLRRKRDSLRSAYKKKRKNAESERKRSALKRNKLNKKKNLLSKPK